MRKVADFVINHAKLMIALFVLLTIGCLGLATQVKINYNLADYVPADSPSTKSLEVMDSEFNEAIPNVRVYVPVHSVTEALELKHRIQAVPKVTNVLWLDDFVNLKTPLEMQNKTLVEGFYKDGGALYQVATDLKDSPATSKALQEIAGPNGSVEGQLLDLAMAQTATSSEMTTIMLIMVPLGVALLCFSTRSWLEPPILLVTIGAAVLINLGTNITRSEISFITQAVTGVLQLAVSMDYGIFLLHARDRNLHEGLDRRESLARAICQAANAIVASSMTTVLGFLALIFMSFQIGPDLGMVLAKGVIFSLICVIFFMPALMVVTDPLLQKTTHRALLPHFEKVGKIVAKNVRWLLLIAILLPFCFVAQGMNDFRYGNSGYAAGSREAHDREVIQQKFGEQLPIALMVPRGDWGREYQLENELKKLPEVLAISSYQSQVSRLIPSEVLPQDKLQMLLSKDYSRMILTVESAKEGTQAFDLVDQVRAIAQKYYPDKYYLVGESVVTADMKTSITHDNAIVNGLAILSVGIVLLISFRSISVPFLLLLTIEGSIRMNLTVPYLTGTHLTYIGYLVISTVQLGATVDYAILFTQHYLANRVQYGKRESIAKTIYQTFRTLLIPAMILTTAGVILSVVSSLEVVSQLGTVLGRGAATSFAMVNLFLPALLVLFDPIIEKTTWKARFLRSAK